MANIIELKKYLESSKVDMTNFELQDTMLVGVFNGKHLVRFEIDEEHNRLYCYSFEKNALFLDELIPILSTFRQDGPCVKYHSRNTIYDIEDTTIEWDEKKEERIEFLRKGHVKENQLVYDVKPYQEDRYLRDMRLGFTTFSKVFFPNGYLCDNNGITMESKIVTYNEQDCFLALNVLESFRDMVYTGTWRGVLPDPIDVEITCSRIRDRVNFLVTGSKSTKKDFEHSVLYLNWYQKWKEYFTYERKCEYMERRLRGDSYIFGVPTEREKEKVLSIGSFQCERKCNNEGVRGIK